MGFFTLFHLFSKTHFSLLGLASTPFSVSFDELTLISEYYEVNDSGLTITLFNHDVRKFLDLLFEYESLFSQFQQGSQQEMLFLKINPRKRASSSYSLEQAHEVECLLEKNPTKLQRRLKVTRLELRQQAQILLDIIETVRSRFPLSNVLKEINPDRYPLYVKEIKSLPLLKLLKS